MNRLLFLLAVIACLPALAVAQLTLDRSVVGCGAPAGTQGSLSLRSTVGQSVTGISTRADPLSHQAGFWYGLSLVGVSAIRDELAGVPMVLTLHQNHPNPFNPTTHIIFDVPQARHTRLRIYDVRGRLVETLVDASLDVGRHDVRFDGTALASGIYIYRLESGTETLTRRLVLLK
ncbi:MAG: T9SS type A sorting domain-containing protein [bacterium]|nr:T9SS type A sorting domain-containing protein [bacterium]